MGGRTWQRAARVLLREVRSECIRFSAAAAAAAGAPGAAGQLSAEEMQAAMQSVEDETDQAAAQVFTLCSYAVACTRLFGVLYMLLSS